MDFIASRAPCFKKAWDHSFVQLGTPDLFTREPERTKRTAVFSMTGRNKLNPGDYVRIIEANGCLVAMQEMSEVARADNPTPDLLGAVLDSYNIACGIVDQVYELSETVDIYLN